MSIFFNSDIDETKRKIAHFLIAQEIIINTYHKLLFVRQRKIVHEFLYLCEVNDQNHGFSFAEPDLVLVSTEARFEFRSTEFGFRLWFWLTSNLVPLETKTNSDFCISVK